MRRVGEGLFAAGPERGRRRALLLPANTMSRGSSPTSSVRFTYPDSSSIAMALALSDR